MTLNLFDQLSTQLREARQSYSVASDGKGGVRVELFLEPEPKPFWHFDRDNNLVETNQ
jgi:hypothetical protein